VCGGVGGDSNQIIKSITLTQHEGNLSVTSQAVYCFVHCKSTLNFQNAHSLDTWKSLAQTGRGFQDPWLMLLRCATLGFTIAILSAQRWRQWWGEGSQWFDNLSNIKPFVVAGVRVTLQFWFLPRAILTCYMGNNVLLGKHFPTFNSMW
jgi:hypothetical protein